MQNWRVANPEFDRNMSKIKEHGALDFFVNQTESPNSIISQDLRDRAFQAIGNTVQLPVINYDGNVTVGSARTCTIADAENTSALYSVVFSTYQVGFTMVPAAYSNNDISYEQDWNRKMQKSANALASALDQSAITALAARKTTVFADLLYYTETAKLLNQAKAELKSTKDLYIGLQTKFEEQAKTHKTELFGLRVENELTNVLNGLKFKAEIPANVTKTFVNAAISKVKGLNPDYVDDVNGGKRLVFRDSNGVAISNPTNLAPYTEAELLGNELKDIIAIKGAKGTGTQVDGGGGNNDTVTIGNARTQQEAMTIISKSLCAQGFTAGSKEYQTKLDAAWAENKVKSLPVK